ncbi:MAG: universal stress protein [Alphaproteobacteria bacterium]|nr:universal stress protein [Alphaproteobacteria bacterium]MCB9975951.1 universal stress protein [Rhodospirillales bacterium]
MSRKKNRKIGGIYLLVVDDTAEFSVAIDYASDFAKANNGQLALLNVIEIDQIGHWVGVEGKMRKERRDQAEKMIWQAAGRITERTGLLPMVCIEEGSRSEAVLDTIERYPDIRMLILGGDSNSSSPGPLVTYFAGKGLARLRVPLLIVPGHLEI